jgi:hypothetical protein
MIYAPTKSDAESMARLPFNWREGLPKRGWKIFSENPPLGRREIAVQADKGILVFRSAMRQGKEYVNSGKQNGERLLTPEQLIEAVTYANLLWATNPVLGGAHRTRIKQQVTLVLSDGDYFKAFSSVDPASEIHRFNEQLWAWVGDEKALRR